MENRSLSPLQWRKEFKKAEFRGAKCGFYRAITLDGQERPDKLVPLVVDDQDHEVVVEMG